VSQLHDKIANLFYWKSSKSFGKSGTITRFHPDGGGGQLAQELIQSEGQLDIQLMASAVTLCSGFVLEEAMAQQARNSESKLQFPDPTCTLKPNPASIPASGIRAMVPPE
jgi:hypothetical protein